MTLELWIMMIMGAKYDEADDFSLSPPFLHIIIIIIIQLLKNNNDKKLVVVWPPWG